LNASAAASKSTVSAQAVPSVPASAGTAVAVGPVTGSSFSRVGSASVPAVNDEATLIADLASSAPFFKLNTTKRWPMASITKLMTATIVLDKLSATQEVMVTPSIFAADPSEKILQVNGTYTVADLLRVMLLPSSNVAAEALASAYGRDAFIAEMNARAAQWGMTNTHYDDPSGLSVADQSTAIDLLALAQRIYANYPQIFAITRTPQVTITEAGSGAQVVVKSINSFAGHADFVGGKTGYTDQANGNLLSVFFYENHPVFVLVLGTDDNDRFTNTEKLYNWFTTNFK
jgi:D-alanyl-D-alanine carboxypeptidase